MMLLINEADFLFINSTTKPACWLCSGNEIPIYNATPAHAVRRAIYSVASLPRSLKGGAGSVINFLIMLWTSEQ